MRERSHAVSSTPLDRRLGLAETFEKQTPVTRRHCSVAQWWLHLMEEPRENRCQFWLPKKKSFCANAPLDASFSVLEENLEGHIRRCPLLKQTRSLSLQPYYQRGINCGRDELQVKDEEGDVSAEMKRNAVYSMTVSELTNLSSIRSVHSSVCKHIRFSYKMPDACDVWIKREVDRKLPYQAKHVLQQASILGNLEDFGVLKVPPQTSLRESLDSPMLSQNCQNDLAVIEFGAGRGYLTQMLADCYGIRKVFLVERKSYKLKADRSLRQKESLVLERLRIGIEDLNLNAVEALRGISYLAIGKHICGPATDLTLRCCLPKHHDQDNGIQQTAHHHPRV
ncbi:hypothetical protein Ancab_019898 [Ancistrocladus abbreviatus]